MANALGRTLPSLTAQGARSGAINYGFYTLPYGFLETTKVALQLKIGDEVSRVYTTRDNPSGVYLLIRAVDPVKAEAYWAAHKKGSTRRALDILNSVNIQRSTSTSILKAARTGRRASVPKKIQPRSLVTRQELKAIQKRQMQLAGFAKAGWYAAARSLGRVRSSVVADDGSRNSVQVFPAYIRAIARKYPGLGSARTVASQYNAATTITSHVRHAAEAIPDGLMFKAEESAQRAFRETCRLALSHIIRNRHRAA
jgi:hypothetical protein